MNRDEIAQGLIRIGEQGIAREDDEALNAYFTDDFVWHGPDGDLDLQGLKRLFAALRDAFTDLTVTRGHIVVEGAFVAAQTTFSGVFDQEYTLSPVGALSPTHKPFTMTIHNIFRLDETGRTAEEWVQFDQRGMLRQLGAKGR